jgi:hypothetical protein
MEVCSLTDLETRIHAVRERINAACFRAGRKPEEVTLVAVTKTVTPETVSEAYRLGIEVFAENRVQEAIKKVPQVCPGPQWHLIGHLQSNKVKKALPLFRMIHSVDSLSLLETLQREAAAQEFMAQVLLEVNVSGEASKYGFRPDQTASAVRAATAMENIRLCGLMTMAPYSDHPENARPVFRGLKQLFSQLHTQEATGPFWRELSMGMSNDFEVAIEEGATMVRVGSAIFNGC